MILQRLAEHYDRIASNPENPTATLRLVAAEDQLLRGSEDDGACTVIESAAGVRVGRRF